MVKSYKKGAGTQVSENFNQREFDCHCTDPACQLTLIDLDLVMALEELRLATGAVTIDDAFRCDKHNAAVGGVKASQHPQGKAADVKTALGPATTADLAEKVPAFAKGGIGRYNTFTHVDVRGYRARWRVSGPKCSQ